MIVNFLLGKRDRTGPDEIAEFVRKSEQFDPNTEQADKSGVLLLFRTSQQQTWLVATPERLYCVLDDIRKPQPQLKWVMAKDELIANGEVSVQILVHDYSRNSGRVDIGPHGNWLFSKALFSATPVEEAIAALIRKHMIDAQAKAYA